MLLGLIVYLPFLHAAFKTFSLPLVDMLIIMALAFTVVPVLETAKWMERKGWFGSMA
jgi:Ca2+-transporting ATPase